MAKDLYPAATPQIAALSKELAPEINEAFEQFSRAVFAEGALPGKTKQLIAVAVAHVTQCPYCITGHTKLAHRSPFHTCPARHRRMTCSRSTC